MQIFQERNFSRSIGNSSNNKSSSPSLVKISLLFFLLTASVTTNAEPSVNACSETPNTSVDRLHFIPGYGYSDYSKEALEHYMAIVETTSQKIFNVLSANEKGKLDDLVVCIDTWNKERFGFYYNPNGPGGNGRIVLGFQSLAVLSNISAAISISENLNVDSPFRWWRSYALYLRRSADWSQIKDPLSIFNRKDARFLLTISSGAEEYFGQMLSFIIAHEMSHGLLKHNKSETLRNITLSERKDIVRKWEENSDKYAMQILSRQEAFYNDLGPSGASLIFLNFHLIDGVHGSQDSTHPADTQRMLSFSKYVLEELDHSQWPVFEWKSMRAHASSFGEKALAAEEAGYFKAFNRESESIILDKLAFDRFE